MVSLALFSHAACCCIMIMIMITILILIRYPGIYYSSFSIIYKNTFVSNNICLLFVSNNNNNNNNNDNDNDNDNNNNSLN